MAAINPMERRREILITLAFVGLANRDGEDAAYWRSNGMCVGPIVKKHPGYYCIRDEVSPIILNL